MSQEIRDFIRDHSALFWYTPQVEKENIGEALLVETVLNEGTMDDVRRLFNIMGINHVADVFFAAKGRAAQNYYPEIRNYFTLVFNRYAHRDSQS